MTAQVHNLASCPCCGHKTELEVENETGVIYCTHCELQTPVFLMSELEDWIGKWNRRPLGTYVFQSPELAPCLKDVFTLDFSQNQIRVKSHKGMLYLKEVLNDSSM